jgi:protein phosphatase
VIDATNLEYRARRPFLRLARRHGVPVIALVFSVALETCQIQNQARLQRIVPTDILQKHALELAQTQQRLGEEGYAAIYQLNERSLNAVKIVRSTPLEGGQS